MSVKWSWTSKYNMQETKYLTPMILNFGRQTTFPHSHPWARTWSHHRGVLTAETGKGNDPLICTDPHQLCHLCHIHGQTFLTCHCWRNHQAHDALWAFPSNPLSAVFLSPSLWQCRQESGEAEPSVGTWLWAQPPALPLALPCLHSTGTHQTLAPPSTAEVALQLSLELINIITIHFWRQSDLKWHWEQKMMLLQERKLHTNYRVKSWGLKA